MTTHIPRPPYIEQELEALYPPALELTQVHIFLRHGERTPVSQRFTNAGLPAFWPFCSAMGSLRSPVLLPALPPQNYPPALKAQFMYWRKRIETWSSDSDSPALAYPGIRQGAASSLGENICEQGMLTDRGRETTTALGQRLRQLYVRDLGFLPPVLTPAFVAEEAFFRSTAVPRTIESLMQTIGGVWPSGWWDSNDTRQGRESPRAHLEKTVLGWNKASDATHAVTPRTAFGSFPLDVVVRQAADEDLYPNDWNCRRFAHLARSFASRAAERWNGTDDMSSLTRRLGKWMPTGEVKLDGKPRLTGLMDTINATRAHDPTYLAGLKVGGGASEKEGWDVYPLGNTLAKNSQFGLPREFYDKKVLGLIEKLTVEEWFGGYSESREYRMLGIGALMGDVVERMVRSAEYHNSPPSTKTAGPGKCQAGQQKTLKFSLSGCHDTTLAAMTISMGDPDVGKWPPFTSHVAIELFRDPAILLPATTPDSGSATADEPQEPRRRAPRKESASDYNKHTHDSAVEKLEHLLHLHSHKPTPVGRRKMETLDEEERDRMRGWYVRMRYNDRPMKIPGCASKDKHWKEDEGLCTLGAFKDIVDKFTPDNWREQCLTTEKRAEFPQKPELPGY